VKLLANEFYLAFAELRRHYWEPVFGVAVVSGLFLGLYFGVRALAQGRLSVAAGDLDGLLLGYVSWGVAGAAYNSVARHVTQESQTGTLEQLYLSPHRFSSILICRTVVHMTSGLCSAAALAVIAMVGTGRWLHVPLWHVVTLLLLSSVSLIGVGLAIGGVVLLQKRLSAAAAVLNILLLVFVSVPAFPWNAAAALPFSYGASAVRAIAAGRAEPSLALYVVVAANSAVWLVLGVVSWSALEHRARSTNALGQH